MPVEIISGDITKIECDAIVNAANNTLLGGGGVDGCIHRAAGPELLAECRTLGGCQTGDAKITKGYRLPCSYVIHTVGPMWHGGSDDEEKLLISCYRKSLELAAEYKCNTVAFPLISSGIYGYPKAEAFKVATDTIMSYLEEYDSDMIVYIVIYKGEKLSLADARLQRISEFVRTNINEPDMLIREACYKPAIDETSAQVFAKYANVCMSSDSLSLENMLNNLDESFSQALLRLIDESGMTDSQCYSRANVDRRLFSKIRNNPDYKPSKETVIAFAVALKLSISETESFLKKAGYSLSKSKPFDVIIEYCINEGIYNIMDINTLLFNHDQKLLGGAA